MDRSNQTEVLRSAQSLMQSLTSMLDAAFSEVRHRCVDRESGRLNAALLDENQQVSYELAFVVAELAATSALVSKAEFGGELETLVALAQWSCALNAAQSRLLPIADECGLERDGLCSFFNQQSLVALQTKFGSSKALARLGERLCAAEIQRLPSVLDTDKEMMRATFERFANEIVAPRAEAIHRQDLDIPDEILIPAAELGCFGTCIPERFGGLQPDDKPDSLSMIVVTEELSRGSLGAAGSLITRPEIAARALLAGGTDEQQQKWLPKLAAGKTLCAISITEPNTGSDVASVALRATRTETGWKLNGAKTWCTFAGRSELLVVLARTEDDRDLGYRGLSLFLVEKPACVGHEFTVEQDGGGMLSGRAIATLGYRGMHSFELAFDEFVVPESALLGGEAGRGRGFYYTMAGFAGGRIQTAARATGLMQAALEKAMSYARERSTFGTPLASYQLIQIKIAKMFATVSASRQFSYDVAALMDEGAGQMEASLVKLFSCRAAETVTREAMQIHGGMGYAEEMAVSRYFVDARVLSIFEGAEEVLALKVIARELIENAKVI
jgi:(2S)-methylsuccinyl-CoA dehydrogenase